MLGAAEIAVLAAHRLAARHVDAAMSAARHVLDGVRRGGSRRNGAVSGRIAAAPGMTGGDVGDRDDGNEQKELGHGPKPERRRNWKA